MLISSWQSSSSSLAPMRYANLGVPIFRVINDNKLVWRVQCTLGSTSFFALRLFWITFPPPPPLFMVSPTGALWLGDLLSLPAQVTSVVFFNIGPRAGTPFTEYGLFDSVRKPRPNPNLECLRLRPNCGNIFCGKILVPVNDRVFAKNVSQIFRRQIGPICPQPVARKNLGNKFHFYEPIWKRLFQIRTNLKKAFFKLVRRWSADLLSFSTQLQLNRHQNKWWKQTHFRFVFQKCFHS